MVERALPVQLVSDLLRRMQQILKRKRLYQSRCNAGVECIECIWQRIVWQPLAEPEVLLLCSDSHSDFLPSGCGCFTLQQLCSGSGAAAVSGNARAAQHFEPGRALRMAIAAARRVTHCKVTHDDAVSRGRRNVWRNE